MGQNEAAYQRLFLAIREGWEAIGQEAIKNLVERIETQIDSVLTQKDGTHTSEKQFPNRK